VPSLRKAIALALLGMLAGAAATLLLSTDSGYQSWAYHYFREDYAKAGWVYDRMISAPRPTDNLFVGSSHMLNAIDDGLIAKQFATLKAAYNAGIPTSARNLQYLVFRDIVSRNKPRRLFLELRETEERTSHFGFAILARVGDAFGAPASPWWARDVLWMLQRRFEYLSQRFLPPQPSTVRADSPEYGYLPNLHQVPPDQLAHDVAAAAGIKQWRVLPTAFGNLEFRANKLYVEQIAKLCRDDNIELHFLYLPFFGAPRQPIDVAYYERLGLLHLLPEEIAGKLEYWADVTHFNPKGAEAYTRWLIGTALTAGEGENTRR
jgi:hypothetical protein